MSRRLKAVVLSVCAIVSIAPSSNSQGQTSTRTQRLILEISIIEMTGARPDAIESLEKTREQLDLLVKEGKAVLITNLYVRTQPGDSFKARIGKRVPIQTGTLPVFQTIDRDREPVQPRTASAGIPQIAYENTGFFVEGSLIATSDGLVDIRLNLEETGLDRSTGRLTPTLTQRSFSDVVRMKISETAVVMRLTQPHAEPPSLSEIASGTAGTILSRSSFIVLLTTRPVQ